MFEDQRSIGGVQCVSMLELKTCHGSSYANAKLLFNDLKYSLLSNRNVSIIDFTFCHNISRYYNYTRFIFKVPSPPPCPNLGLGCLGRHSCVP